MSNPKMTPFLREKIEAFMSAHREMIAEMDKGISDATDDAVERFDAAVEDVRIAARAAGFGAVKVPT